MLLTTYFNLYSIQVLLRPHYECAGNEEYSVRSYNQRVFFGAVAADGSPPPDIEVGFIFYLEF